MHAAYGAAGAAAAARILPTSPLSITPRTLWSGGCAGGLCYTDVIGFRAPLALATLLLLELRPPALRFGPLLPAAALAVEALAPSVGSTAARGTQTIAALAQAALVLCFLRGEQPATDASRPLFPRLAAVVHAIAEVSFAFIVLHRPVGAAIRRAVPEADGDYARAACLAALDWGVTLPLAALAHRGFARGWERAAARAPRAAGAAVALAWAARAAA